MCIHVKCHKNRMETSGTILLFNIRLIEKSIYNKIVSNQKQVSSGTNLIEWSSLC
jgi:hypothetical protein